VPDQADDVTLGRVEIEAEDDVRGGEVKKTEGMAEDQLGQREKAAQPMGGRGRVESQDTVPGLGCSQGMADRTDAADTGGDGLHLPEGPADTEGFEPPELLDHQACLFHLSGIIQQDADSGVTLDAGHRRYGDEPAHVETVSQYSSVASLAQKNPDQAGIYFSERYLGNSSITRGN